jgi:hypothetical protein
MGEADPNAAPLIWTRSPSISLLSVAHRYDVRETPLRINSRRIVFPQPIWFSVE